MVTSRAGAEGRNRDVAEVAAACGLPAERLTADQHSPVSEHVRAGLDTRLRAMIKHDPGTRLGRDPEELHQMRVSVRRMRAMLRSGRSWLDQSRSEPLRAELGWLGRLLGPVRDLDVLLERLRASSEGFGTADAAAAARLISGLEVEHGEARHEMLAALDDDRYTSLVESLVAYLREGSSEPESTTDARRELRRLVRKRYRALDAAVSEIGVDPTDEQLHSVRILGKKLRYTTELAEPLFGKPAQRLLAAAKEFQDVLGEHQDAHVAEARVRELLAALGGDADTRIAFVAGRLAEREAARRARCREQWLPCWRALRRRAEKF